MRREGIITARPDIADALLENAAFLEVFTLTGKRLAKDGHNTDLLLKSGLFDELGEGDDIPYYSFVYDESRGFSIDRLSGDDGMKLDGRGNRFRT